MVLAVPFVYALKAVEILTDVILCCVKETWNATLNGVVKQTFDVLTMKFCLP